MCREKGSLKVNQVSKMKSVGFPHISGDADEILHSKLVLADPSEVIDENAYHTERCAWRCHDIYFCILFIQAGLLAYDG